jgi:shikimate kinase
MNPHGEIIALVGMSGVGKSHWGKRLEGKGFQRFDCDTEIAKLGAMVDLDGTSSPVHAIGAWMGMPWSEGYKARETRYLALEKEVTLQAIERAKASEGPLVIDCTGSVIYLGKEVLEALRSAAHVVHIQAPQSLHRTLLQRYTRKPKPIVWKDAFRIQLGETNEQALARCYPGLLNFREERYRALAHRGVSGEELAALTEARALTVLLDKGL